MSVRYGGRLSWRPFRGLAACKRRYRRGKAVSRFNSRDRRTDGEQSIELPTKEAVRHNQVWCGALSDFDELIICVERTERIEFFSDKARSQVQGIQSAEPTTATEYKQLNDVIKDIQSNARAAERYLRIGTGTQTKRLSDY